MVYEKRLGQDTLKERVIHERQDDQAGGHSVGVKWRDRFREHKIRHVANDDAES